jgi:hypothetical protein
VERQLFVTFLNMCNGLTTLNLGKTCSQFTTEQILKAVTPLKSLERLGIVSNPALDDAVNKKFLGKFIFLGAGCHW